MKKQRPFRNSFSFYIIFILLVILVFFGIIEGPHIVSHYQEKSSMNSLSESALVITPTPQPTPTALPENYPDVIRDYFENENETNGLLYGAAVLLLIIFIGVFVSKRNNEK